MQVGCGVYELSVHGRRYLYFWHYETRGGRRRQLKDYIGPVGSVQSREEAARRCEAYCARAVDAIDRARAATLANLRAAR